MQCNFFISQYHSYTVTKDGKVYSKYENNKILSTKVKDGYNEVLFSFGTGKERIEQWFRVDHLVASKFILNLEDYDFLHHKDGNLLNDSADNLEWREFCVDNEPAKFINGYRHKYIITPSGKIYNNFTGKQMKPRLITGYPHVGLRVYDGNSSTQKLFKVHRLVAEYFLPKVDGKNIVNHKDGDKTNCNVSNLEWCTYKENSDHAIITGLKKSIWSKELARIAISLIEDYNYSSSDVAKELNKKKSSVKYLYSRGYKNLGLQINKNFKLKTSKYVKKLNIPESLKRYIADLLKDNTVLNSCNKRQLSV